ncbi:L,D-transpeptidase [Mesorhizobium sp. BE184]|uniref:L,D-transpeptidase family protein n=1 Tax=Mesorhizobium sp. BE184 TaxID=2817714 RepID=UPI00286AA4AF|nr:L,D-transpeptidase [Mesorhizobium sp. BE184]
MLRTVFVFSALSAALMSSNAWAASGPDLARDNRQKPMSEEILVAQNGDYEIFYDGRGNRVIIDAYTGKVIAVQPPQTRFDRRAERARQFDSPPAGDDRYYLDDPEDMARFRRRQAEEEGRLLGPDDGSTDAFPPAPGGVETYPVPDQPDVVTSQPIERRPLDGSQDEASIAPTSPLDPAIPSDQESVPQAPRIDNNTAVNPRLSLGARDDIAALQILLDRGGASPGVIDGRFGSNVDKALEAYRELTGVHLRSTDTASIKEALAKSGGDAFASYTITSEDAAGPYVASVPEDYSEKAKLDRMAYTSVPEALAERFHMDEAYLKALNPEANFNRPGTIIKVANFGRLASTPVERIIADKRLKQVRAYDASGKLVAAYPATIGSTDTPSPTGSHAVSRVALDPNYTYNPNLNFKQGNNDKVLTIPPGPNGPVGSVWIALDKPTYGIHGTPEPSKIGKTESHGCVRLTNWDARELAKLVKPGVMVEFSE